MRPWPRTESRSAATTTPSSGRARPGSRTSADAARPASPSSPSGSSPGRGWSRRRASTSFGWLDEVMDLLHGAGIGVDLATATASPPPWLTRRTPRCCRSTTTAAPSGPAAGRPGAPARRVYREHALALTRQLPQRYPDHPALAMWHVSNEYGCHNVPCYCDTCAGGLPRLAARALRRPRRAQRRLGHGVLEPALHRLGPGAAAAPDPDVRQPDPAARLHAVPVGRAAGLLPRGAGGAGRPLPRRPGDDELHDDDHVPPSRLPPVGPDQDVVSNDHYVVDGLAHPRVELAFSADLTRGLAGGRPWLLMEHSTSAVNWQPRNRAKAPGQTIRDSLAHVARGADAVGFFQWRPSRAGRRSSTRRWSRTPVRTRAVPGGVPARRDRPAARRGGGSRVRGPGRVLLDCQAGWAVGGPAMPTAASTTSTVAETVYRLLRTAASPSTWCTRAPTSPATGSSSSRPSTW